MSDVAIRCENIGSAIASGLRRSTRRCVMSSPCGSAAPFRRNGRRHQRTSRHVWALDDVSFEIKPGEVVGIIGHNGAGKSTLLKILSRITKPTRGYAEINGRVGSLLEVGTGFHPELTGRENIYFNGAILGMTQARDRSQVRRDRRFRGSREISRHAGETLFERDVRAAGVRCRRASGTEILMVDEVLAVGDAQFQKKCFGKMSEIGRQAARFCSSVTTWRRSEDLRRGDHSRSRQTGGERRGQRRRRSLSGPGGRAADEVVETNSFTVNSVEISSSHSPVIKTFDPVEVRVSFVPKAEVADAGLYVSILTPDFRRLTGLDFKDFATAPPLQAGEVCELGFAVESLPLLPGVYQLEVHLKDMARGLIETVPRAYQFEVAETQVYGGRKLDRWFGTVGLRARAFNGAHNGVKAQGCSN